jgi:cellulose synthase/poly-beta-1,6-N-acetylglucosamine synthase-like glycosyltransferase
MEDAISFQQVPQSMDGYVQQHIRWGRGLNDVARVHSLETLKDRKLPWSLRLELLLFTAGYLDRLALMSTILLAGLSYLLEGPLFPLLLIILFSLAMPLVQIVILFLRERVNIAMWVRLPLVPIFFAIDIFAAMRAMCDSLLNQPRLWSKTERGEIP